ncbi:hypothetical protein MM239_20640 [Belliella sp. DSM 111904]|uniref:DoxX protein n=1 Tax=Belliella filtrata TaxID=2923435 RepID=A0ABS9V5W1_9BACT|nr:hypothetical protein [Belliella filtrata]MCH7411807.1 hypothetical protein [Belliella filtrata]
MNNRQLTALMIRLALGFIYLSAGLSRLAPEYLGNIIGPVYLPEILKSDFIIFIWYSSAIYEVIVGSLILSQKYSPHGLLLVIPLSIALLILTIFLGFGATPIFNCFFTIFLIFALIQEKIPYKKILQGDSTALNRSKTPQLYPAKQLSLLSLTLIILTIGLIFWQGYHLNILASLAILGITINLFQFRNYYKTDYFFIFLFFAIAMIALNGNIIKHTLNNFIYWQFGLIGFAMLLFLLRIGISRLIGTAGQKSRSKFYT